MKKLSMVSLGGLAAAAALTTVGIGTAVAAPDYGALAVNPNAVTDSTAYVPMPAVLNPGGQQGVEQEFNHRDGSRGITTTIVVLPTPQEATSSMDASRSGLASIVANQTSQPVTVGTGGTLVTGTSPDGSQSVGVLLFTEANAAVEVQFDGPTNDPVPADLVTQYGQDQLAAIHQQLGT